jgi:hypothetical protein
MRNDSKDEGRIWVMSLSHASVSINCCVNHHAAPTTMIIIMAPFFLPSLLPAHLVSAPLFCTFRRP